MKSCVIGMTACVMKKTSGSTTNMLLITGSGKRISALRGRMLLWILHLHCKFVLSLSVSVCLSLSLCLCLPPPLLSLPPPPPLSLSGRLVLRVFFDQTTNVCTHHCLPKIMEDRDENTLTEEVQTAKVTFRINCHNWVQLVFYSTASSNEATASADVCEWGSLYKGQAHNCGTHQQSSWMQCRAWCLMWSVPWSLSLIG